MCVCVCMFSFKSNEFMEELFYKSNLTFFSQIFFFWIDMYNILKVLKCEIQGLHKCFGFDKVILVILII
jgi:hypothetical protein